MWWARDGADNRRLGGNAYLTTSRVFRATEGSTEHSPLVFGVETALWQVAAKKEGKWYREVHEAAERFMVR